jgi:hypothetical protein
MINIALDGWRDANIVLDGWREAWMSCLTAAQCLDFASDGGAMLQYCAEWWHDASILRLMVGRCLG